MATGMSPRGRQALGRLLRQAIAAKALLRGALEIPLVTEDQRPLREFRHVLRLGRQHIGVVLAKQPFAWEPAQLGAHDRAVEYREHGTRAPKRLPNRGSVPAFKAVQIVMMQVQQGHRSSSEGRRAADRAKMRIQA